MQPITVRLVLAILVLGALLAEAVPWDLIVTLQARISRVDPEPHLTLYAWLWAGYLWSLAATLAVAAWIIVRLGVPRHGPVPLALMAAALFMYACGPTIQWFRWVHFAGRPPPWLNTQVPDILVALAFKALAFVALYHALRVDKTEPAGKRPYTFRTVIAVALAVYAIFPLWNMALAVGSPLWNELKSFRVPRSLFDVIVAYLARSGVAIAMALILLVFGVRGGILRSRPDTQFAKFSYRALLVYLILVPLGILAGGMPYGSGPPLREWVVIAAQLLGLLAIGALLPWSRALDSGAAVRTGRPEATDATARGNP